MKTMDKMDYISENMDCLIMIIEEDAREIGIIKYIQNYIEDELETLSIKGQNILIEEDEREAKRLIKKPSSVSNLSINDYYKIIKHINDEMENEENGM